MRKALVLYKDLEAGMLEQLNDGSFEFAYHDAWLQNSTNPSISITLPKTKGVYHANFLFPFFFNMLPEGANKQTVCFQMRIDESDHFGILLNTAHYDTIGAVRIVKIEEL